MAVAVSQNDSTSRRAVDTMDFNVINEAIMANPNPLDHPATLRQLRRWQRAGALDPETFREWRTLVQPRATWRAWLTAELLWTGAALVLAGITFFFAWNWQGMGRFQKLGVIEAALAGSLLTAWRMGLETSGGQVLMLAATVLTGVFLAVFGQIYQTGADAFELFTGWAALTLVWVIAGRKAPLWFLWLIIVQTGAVLFWNQVAMPAWRWPWDSLFLVLAGINSAALAVREGWGPRPPSHDDPWLRVALVLSLLASLTLPVLGVILNNMGQLPLQLGHVPLWLAVAAAVYWFYRHVRPSFGCVAVVAANAVMVALFAVGRLMFSGKGDVSFLYILMALIVVASTAGLTTWLAREYRAIKRLC